MGRFSRSANRWLNQLFLPSQTPAIDPLLRSDDVQLVEMYTGGGFSIAEPTEWFSRSSVTVAGPVPDEISIGSEPVNQITRLLGASVRKTVAPLADVIGWIDILPPGLVPAARLPISDRFTLTVANGTERVRIIGLPPVLGPEHRLFFRQLSGSVGDFEFDFYFVSAPRGTTFTA